MPGAMSPLIAGIFRVRGTAGTRPAQRAARNDCRILQVAKSLKRLPGCLLSPAPCLPALSVMRTLCAFSAQGFPLTGQRCPVLKISLRLQSAYLAG